MELWQPNKLVQDDANVAYQPTDKQGKQIAASLTMYLRLLMWRVRVEDAKRCRTHRGAGLKSEDVRYAEPDDYLPK